MKDILCRVISSNCDKTGIMVTYDSLSDEEFISWVKRICEGMISMEIINNVIKVQFDDRYELYTMKDHISSDKKIYSKRKL